MCIIQKGKKGSARGRNMPGDMIPSLGEAPSCHRSAVTHRQLTSLSVSHHREVLSVSRKLLREREDMCKDLSRLHESTLELHDRLLGQLQQLSAENRQLRRRLQEPADEPPDQLDEASELANTLHVRWQHCQRAWFSAPLADTQHRLLMAEQAWKRLRASRKDNVTSMTSAQEIVR